MNAINKIRKENIEDIMDLTDTQKGMLYHYIKDADTKEYQEQTCITITGEIDIEILKKAWKHIIETNEMLRTIYKWDKLDRPVQIVLKNYEVPFKFVDLSKENNKAKDKLSKEILETHKNENIDITEESIKITICKIEEYKCKMIIKNHHILYDGWSNGIILREFIEAYNAYFQGKEPIKAVKNKFKQLLKWNKQQDRNRQKEYWENYLKDFEHESNIFNLNNTSKMHRHIGERTYIIPDSTKNKLEECAKKIQVSVAAILYSVWSILQQRYENSEDIIFGMTVSGRTAKIKDIDNMIGMFINTIPLRVKTHSNEEASTLIKSVEESLRAHEEFENTSLLDIKSYGKPNHEKNLFDNIVVIENYPLDKVTDKNSKIKIEDCFISETTNFNLTFGISIFDDLEIKVSYNKELFQDEFILRMTRHYENILNEILSNVSINISEIEIISEEERNTLLYDFNDTYGDYLRDKTIHELFEEQVEKTPDNIAIVFENKELTYRELNEKANKLARTLREKGVKADSIVGIMVERSIEMIVGIIGVLKAGGAYLPIDSEYPEDRIRYMIEDSNTNILLTQINLIGRIGFHGEVIDLKDEKLYSNSSDNLENISTSRDLAYVIYTSGSTGNPKGVMIEHKALNNFRLAVNKRTELSTYKNILCLTTISFDIFALETLVPLLIGIKVIIADETEQVNSLKLNEIIIKNNIEVLQITPSRLQLLMLDESFKVSIKALKIVMVGGESFPENILKQLNNYSNINIYNMYGPTETTVWSSIRDLTGTEDINIGKPISNTQIYIVDKNNNLQTIGTMGELCISGDGLARGYVNNSKLTAEKFVPNPFVEGERMYKTGDLAKWLPDGSIEFLGRIDHQVKIRGFRIELGEIESQLLSYETIRETIVVDREDENGTKYLCAYLVSEKELTVGGLRNYLLKNLPEYMIPSYFVQLDKLPLTPNGKIDRKALPKPDGSIVTGTEYEAARNKVEEKLIKIWSEVLEVEKLGINDNFFELGGHSLKATALVSKIHKELNVEVPLREIFKFPTIKGTREYIESTEKSIYSSIEIVEDKEYYEASSAQKRMYMLQQFDLKSTGYNMPGVMVVEGKLDVERLEKSFTQLIRRHETLRTSFETIEDKIVQRVNESVNFKLDCFESTDKAADKIVKNFVKAFDLSKAPLLRVGLIKLEEEKHVLMYDMHHIISDGASMGVLINEFAKIYEGNKLEQLRIQYKDYSQWQNSLLKSEAIEEQKEYWINRFKDEIPVLNMRADFKRPIMQSFEGENISFKLDKELTKDLKRISKETGSTMYMVLLSGVNILLSKYSGQEDIIVGSPIAGRPHADLEKIIGMFVNTLAMRNHPEGSKTYEDFLKEVKENALKAYENQDYQFDELVDNLSIPRDVSRNPLFDVMFTIQNMDLKEIELKNLVFKGYKQENRIAKFDLTFAASEVGEEIILNLEYCTKLYKRETIERMAEHFVNIIKVVTGDIKIKLSEIEMLTEKEKHRLLYEFNDTHADYPRDKTIHELFQQQAQKTPDNIAIVFEDKELTYRELNERANKLARNLREKGVKNDSIVAIMVERSIEMIIGIMGVLKAGGAYLPIDPEYPEYRIRYIFEDSKTNILLTQSNLLNKVTFNGTIIDLIDEKVYEKDKKNLEHVNVPKDLAYIIYTSGTTGKPKGAMIEHRNVVRLMFNEKMQFDFNEKDVWTMFHSYCFDFSVWEMYGALLYGGKLVLISKNTARDTEEYLKTLKQERVTILNQIPTPFYNLMNKELNCSKEDLKLRYVIFGGEALKPDMLSKWIKKYPETKLINMYGITETTVHVTYKEIREEEISKKISNIGKPIPTLSTYIMDKNLKLQPIGVPGELCVGGEGVGRGYLNNKELSEEKFVSNPYKTEEKIYRSGDLARILINGELEYLGRIDHQVKVRGFRIELGEIESQLLNYEEIKDVIVLDREDENGAKYLCAYVVSEKQLTVGELREYLSKNLPEYMIPSYFVQLEKMPLTVNGKVDRKALPKPDGSIVTGAEYEAARNEIEEKLVAIWKEVLAVERVGINDNFFELGGHSLKATTLVSKVHKDLNVEVPLREIFKFPTIKGISEYIESTEKTAYSSIEIVEDKEYYEASSAQKRMYMLQQFDLKSIGYNMPGVMMVEGSLESEKLEEAFAELIRRHETLRTSFETIEDKIIQRVNESVNFKLDYFGVDCIEGIDKAVDNIVKDFVKAFDLNKAPLLRVGLIKLEEDKHVLMFDMHHIISDGVSMGILINEFAKNYQGDKLEQLRIQYKDYSQWQNSLLKSDVMQKQKEYWVNTFKDEIPVLNIRADFKRPRVQSFEGENISFKLDKKLTKDLKRISKETGSTMYMVLLSGVNILLSKYSGQEDIIVGSPIAGRPHADLEKIIGMFVNTLAMRNHLDGSRPYEDFLKEVKENALKAYENQDYQFEELVDNLSIPRDISRNPLFDVMFTMQNLEAQHIELKDLVFKEYKQEQKVAKFDLTFSVSEMLENIIINLQYSTKLYKRETVERMREHFINILKAVCADTKIKLSKIDMLTEGEKHKLLFEFNDTYADYSRDKTIHELFEAQVEKTPDNIAVVFKDNKLTYRELNEKSNRLARTLRRNGIKADSIVGIMTEKSMEMIVGIMAILKAGGAYLPIDPNYPEDRIRYMLKDSNSKLLLTQKSFIEKSMYGVEMLMLTDENLYENNTKNLEKITKPYNIVYVIYTSGTTGKPKGVMVEHKSLSNFLFNIYEQFNCKINSNDRCLSLTNISFDVSVAEIFIPLLNNATLVLFNNEEILDIQKLSDTIVNKSITFSYIPPTILRNVYELLILNKEKLSLNKILVGVEPIKDYILEEYMNLNSDMQIINGYGPTEATICATMYKYVKGSNIGKNVPIGEPMLNTRIYIVNSENKIVPIGVTGELCISGDGLARGYIKNEELTTEKFVENPYEPRERMYRTGDLAKWLPNGNIEFLGRIDYQVKIRGFRIELGEIQSQLLNYEGIKESIVLDREDENGSKYLCAYLVSEKELTVGELREYLSRKLPEYMIPSYFVQLDKMPLTPNGKIDRKALPKPDGSIVTGVQYEAARNELEEELVAIWKDVLGVDKVGINDNFFELGGHSLKATTLVSKIHKKLQVEVPLREIFEFPTIKGISEYIESIEKSIYSSIEIVKEKEYYEASSAQKRMYLLQQFDLKSTAYNMPGVMLIEGRLEAERIEKAFTQLIKRHETLRTSFETIEDKIVQRVNESVDFKLDYFEVGCRENQEKAVENIVEHFVKAFDLNKAPLLRVGLIKLEEDKHLLMFDMHHIISDGVSMGILINEFAKLYEGNKLQQLRVQYKDYSQWQNSLLKSETMKEQKEYWINRFKDEIPVLNMPIDFQRPLMQSFEGESISFKLDKELTKDLNRISKETGSTMYMVLLSGINILLSKYSGQEDIIVGSPIAGRPHADLEKIIGMFVNTLAMRNHLVGSRTYEDFLKEVKENALKAYENQDYQFDQLVDNLSIPRDISRNPLFDVMFTMQNIDLEETPLKDLVFKEYEQEHKMAKFDLTFSASEVNEEVIFELQYSTKLYKRETIERMVEHFVNIIKGVTGDIKIKLSEIEMLTEDEKHKLIYEFNGTYVDYPRDETIHELFEKQAQKTPDNIAIVFEDKKLTYRELNERSNRLARTLRKKGVKPDNIVGIMVERSLEMIVGIMGVLKAGGAYLPIDPEYPEDRIAYMLDDSKTNIILTQSRFKENVMFNGEILDLECEKTYVAKVENIENINTARDLAYVIYTSGSTGKPKGVMIEHRNVTNVLTWFVSKYNISDQKHMVNLTEYTFDPSVEQIFGTLISGAKLYIPKKEEILNKNKFTKYVTSNKINVVNFVPAMIKELLLDNIRFDAVDTIIIGGERLEDNVKEELIKLGYKVFNHYGPTEITIDALSASCKEGEKVTLGGPIQNTEVYILDKENNIVPIGVCGELCISGEGLARGYLNRPELTLEKFIENPFALGKRMYKTGDLARWMPDGNIEFLGRIDHQVKIRGFRIELGEIESQLLNHESVKETIVLDREDEYGSKYLCAYLVSEKELTVGELREYLSKNLPEYMIPSYFVQLEKMPLTSNGKIDRKALPKPEGSIVTGTEYEAPRNKVEEKLVAIWKDVLVVERVGINDNFFELGGHSLKATVLSSRMHKELNVEVPLKEIFKFPTIKRISEYIESTEKSIYSSIEIVEEKEYYEASSAQKRMYLLQQLDLKNTGYNMPGVMLIEGRLNVERLENSFALLIRRHETLRTSFETIEDKIVQRVNESVNFKLDYFEIGGMESYEKEVDNIVKDFVKAFDLNKGPLLRGGLIKLEEEKYILMFDMHHIISDGVSMRILINEFSKLYEGNKLQQLRIQYKDYSQWQNDFSKSQVMQEQKKYWINRFKDEIPVLNMRTDFKRPLVKSFEGKNISFKLDKELTKDLKRISKETGSTMYMVLLSGINILLSKYSGQEDIIVGSPIAGRPHADLEKIIGMFVNTLAMRNYPEGGRTYEDFLKEVKENALEAYENQDYQFDELVEKLSIPRDMSRNPLFDVMFTMQNIGSEEIPLKDLVFKEYKQEHKVAKFDLTFSASETVENIILNCEYSTKLYKKETIEIMVEHFVNILKEVSTDINIKLSEIDMLTEVEKHKLLLEFNDTYVEYPRDKTMHELFEKQAQKTPDNIAIVFEDKELTYRELNEKANKLARALRKKGVVPDCIVGIMMNRSLEMIVGMLGILKSGGAYLPIDPEYPEDRIRYMIEDSNTNILLTQSNLIGRVEFQGEVIDLEDKEIYSQKDDNLEKINTTGNLAYVIYTSGSTGKPKGVMIEHRSITTTLQWRKEQYKLNSDDSILQLFSNAFDGFVTSFYTPIISGSKVVILGDSDVKDVFKIRENILLHKITHFISVPSMCLAIIESLTFEEAKSLRIITLAGESLTENVVEKFKNLKGELEIVNEYGPTENSVVTTIMRNIQKDKEITIGSPKANTKIYIVDKKNKLQPIGVAGELCISGEGLARGYLNKLELTSEKFIENPFVSGERMYKTGDLARWLPNGNIEFLGRIDNQVKVRGFRIELGEIESQLLNHESVKETIVLDREDENAVKYLCAYFVSEKELTVGELRKYLSKSLPEYMIPSYFVQLEKMPLTPNGKIDRKALPKPDGGIVTGTEYEAPRNEVEEKLVAIWKDVLVLDQVGINDSFFELGGHSLKATTLVSKIHKELNAEVSLIEIFKSPTIKEISEYIKNIEKSIYSSIEVVEEKEYYEVSSAQKRMYMLQQFDLKSTGYNMPGAMLVEGTLNVERLEKSFAQLIRRHETLRTSFETIEGEIVQRVSENVSFKLECFEVGFIENTDKAVDNIVKDFVKAFDLNKAPLLRVGLIKLEEDKHILMFDVHHIISDGVSMGILINEFVKIYEGNKLEQLRIQYKGYSHWQNKLLKLDVIEEQKEYWINRFSDELPVLNIRADYVRPLIQSFEGENIRFKLDKELTKGLKRISKETGSTMYMVLLSGVNILLSKYSGQEDIIVGSPIAGRPHADLERIIGMFVNTLAMRNYPNGSRTYEDFLKEVKENALKAYENQDYQFDELVDKLSIPRDISRNPLFDVMFTMQNLDSEETPLKDLVFKGYKQEHKVAKFDLTFSASEMMDNIILNLQYSTKLYKKETIERMLEHFINILKAVIANTKIKLSEIEMLTEGEKHKLLYEFNNTDVDYPRDKTIHELFEEQVQKTPDNIAVVFEDKKLTYRELNQRANSLARNLREKGVKPDSIVGIMVERSAYMIVSIMGVLKAGGAYLPIDPEYPEYRIGYMLQDSKAKILLTQEHLFNKVDFDGEIINIQNENVYAQNKDNLDELNTSRDLAYVIYTSGSTGNPKGVMVEQKSVIRLVKNTYYISFEQSDKILQTGTLSFDASTFEIWGAILNGLELHLGSKNTILNTENMEKYINENNITILWLTASLFNFMAEERPAMFKNLRYLLAGGDVLSTNHINKVIDECRNLKIINGYGPTENTTFSTYFLVDKNYETNIPIGRPISNSTAYIIDKYDKLQPIGICGELCVGGEGLARGYLNNPELTAEKFIESPFIFRERMYKTGDLARWLPDGDIEFLGRIDHQVKIRGFRIELGEIESQLLNHESVKEVIVLDKEDENGAKYLCAYLVSEKELTVGELREYLSKKLPNYMIPSHFVQLEKMPLTPNGKIDRKALPEPDGSIVTGTEYEAPRNEVEEKLAVIWSEVLGIKKIGIQDNFFELGGHSLKATVLASKIHKELGVEVPLKEIFKLLTIKEISRYVEEAEKSEYSRIVKVEEKECYPASRSQKRLFIFNQLHPDDISYNMPIIVMIDGKLDINRLENALENMMKRHTILRTSFKFENGEVLQIINTNCKIKVNLLQIANDDLESIVKKMVKPFILSKAPLLKVNYITTEKGEQMLIIDMHHIISDGISMKIFMKELIDLYQEKQLKILDIEYKDFSVWQNNYLNSEYIKSFEKYWIEKMENFNLTRLPQKYYISNEEVVGLNKVLYFNNEDTFRIDKFCSKNGITKFVYFTGVLNIILMNETSSEDITIGIPTAGRNHNQVQNLLGLFLNVLLIRTKIDANNTFKEYFKIINENIMETFENEEYPYEELYDMVCERQDFKEDSLFTIMLNYMPYQNNEEQDEIKAEGITIKPYEHKEAIPKYDMTLYVNENKEDIKINMVYKKVIYEDVVDRIAKSFQYISDRIIENEDNIIRKIDFVQITQSNNISQEFDDYFEEEDFFMND